MLKAFFKKLIWLLRPPRKISFTREGLIFTLFTFPVGFAAINTGNNMLYLILGMLLSIIAMNGILSETTVKKITVSTSLPRAVFAGEKFLSFVEIKNEKSYFPSYLMRLSHRWLEEGAEVREGMCVKLEAGQSTKIRLESRLNQRGIFHLEGFKIATRFPFGLFDKQREVEAVAQVLVYPNLLPTGYEGQSQTTEFGDQQQNYRGMGGDLYSLREYHPDDDARHIHWKVSAKLRRPIIREFSATGKEKLLVVFDTHVSKEDEETFERSVSQVAFLITQAFEEDREVGLWTPQTRFEPESGEAHYHHLMKFLAIVEPFSVSQKATSVREDALKSFFSGTVYHFDSSGEQTHEVVQ